MVSYFKNRKTTYFDVFCLNFSIETKIKTIFQIFYSNLSKRKRNGALGTRIVVGGKACFTQPEAIATQLIFSQLQKSILRAELEAVLS